MSCGFGIGDIIKTIELSIPLRREFADAPRQFQAIANEVRSLSIALQDVEVNDSRSTFNERQQADIQQVALGCQNVLGDLQRTLDSYRELEPYRPGGRSKARRVWKRLTWSPEDIRKLRSRISTNVSLLNAIHGRVSRDNTTKLVRHNEDQISQAMLEWMSPNDYGAQQSDLSARRQPGSGQWLLESPEFLEWTEHPRKVLFCPGIPGAGKTILASLVIDSLRSQFQDDTSIGIAYIYLNFLQEEEQKTNDLFASLLMQLTRQQPSLAEWISTLYDAHRKRNTRPSADPTNS